MAPLPSIARMTRKSWNGRGGTARAWVMASPMRLVVLALTAACSSLNLGFDMPFDVPNVTVSGAPFAVAVDLTQVAKDHELPGSISAVTLSTLDFSVTSDGCFDFVDDVKLTIESNKPGTTLVPAVIATATKPGCVRDVSLTPTTVDLKPYLAEGATIQATGTGVPPAAPITFDGRVVLHAAL